MPLIKDNELVTDPWVALGDDEALPGGAPVIVGLDRWQAERETLLTRNAPLGLRLRSDQLPDAIAEDLDRFQVVALEFPKFGDGRAYSTARLLRERHSYGGELRAVGNVLRDQALFMLRCGFDAFEVAEGTSLEGWREALAEISVHYQPTRDGRRAIPALRKLRGGNGNGHDAARTESAARNSAPDGELQARPAQTHSALALNAAP